MDLTQRLDYDDDEEESSVNRDRPAGNLHMFAGIHGPAQDFHIYRGQNLIGRHASCDITLPAQSVSKKHAVLEVRGDCHTICDNGSLNKTWRRKIALAPNVRYALSNGDFLLFADVACRYTIATVEVETLAVESEDDSELVPATQEPLAAETPVAAIRRIARGPVLARDSGNEEGQTRWNKGGCGSFKESHKTSGPGTVAPPDADTIVPESDEENDTSTSETRLPSLTLPCDSDADTSRRSSFVPSSQNISTPLVLKDQSKQDGRTLITKDKEEIESRKPTDTEMKLRLAVEDNTDSKENQEKQDVKSTAGGDVSEPCVEIVGTVDDKLQEHERILQDDAIKKPSSESMPVNVIEDNVVSSRSELHPEDAPMQQNYVKLSVTDVKLKEDNVHLAKEANIQDEDTATSEADGNTAETSGIQTNKTEEEGNGRSLGSSGTDFHVERETDVRADEAGSGLEKAAPHQVVNIEENETHANVPLTNKDEGGSDSAIDIERDQNVIKAKGDEVTKMIAGPNTTEGTPGLGMDSDTDVDDVDTDIPKPIENKADEDSRSNTEEKKEGFHLDSDTDVEEGDGGSGLEKAKSHQVINVEENENNANVPLTAKNEGSSDSAIDVEADQDVLKSKSDSDDVTKTIAGPNKTEGTTGLGMDSDTDVDDIDTDVPKPVENKADEDSRSNTEEKEGFHLDCDTDVEEDMSTAEVKKAQPEPLQTGTKDVFNLDSDTDVDEEEVRVSSKDRTHGLQDSSAANTDVQDAKGVDSDTDVDDDVQIPGGSNVTLDKSLTEEEPNGKADVVMAKEAAVLHVDSDTDVDDDGDVPAASVLENVGAPDGTTHADGAKKDTEITKEAAEIHLDSDTDVEEDDGSSAGSTQEKVQAEEDHDKEAGGKVDVVVAKEAAVLHVDSDTDVDDDGDVPAASVLENVGAPDGTTPSDGAKKDTEITMEAAELHLDSDTDVEEDDGSSAGSTQEKVQAEEDHDKEAGVEDQKSSVSTVYENPAISGISTEVAKNVPAEIGTIEDETQKSDSESVDLEDMPTQCYLEPEEESDVQEEEEATQAFIFSSTWAEPNPFKHPADPIGLLQISSVTSNTSDDEIDENAIAETQAFSTETEPTGPNVQETEEPVEKSVEKAIQSSSSGEESGKEVQQLSHETLSPDATQPVSQYLSTRASPETGTWLHLKREVPASVWIRGIQQEGDSSNLEGGNEMTEDATQANEQSLNLQLEATQLFSEESPSPAHTETPSVPAADEDNKDDPEKLTERTEQPCSEDTQATDIDATQAYALNVPDSENGATQACSLSEEITGGGDTQATSTHTAATEDDNTQVVNPSVPAEEEVVPETSSKSKEKLTSRRGLSRSKKKEEPAENVPSLSGPEEHPDKTSLVPSSPTEEPRDQSAGEPQRSEPEIKEVQVEKGGRRRGGRRNAELQVKTAAKEDVLAATTSRRRTSKKSSEAERSTSGINEQNEQKQISSESTIHVVNEELKEEHEQSSTNTEEFMESCAPEILPGNPPEKIESLTLEDKKCNAVKQMSRRTRDQVSSESKEILCTEPSTSSTDIQSKMLIESNDDPAEKESNSHINQSKKQTRNKGRVATRLRNEDIDETQSIDTVEKEKDENVGGRNLRTFKKKDTGRQISELPQSEQITQEESQGRKATRKSRVKPSEPDKGEDPTASLTPENKLEEVCPADPESGNGKSRRTRRSLKEEIKEESENIQKGKVQARRSGRLNVVEPINKEQASLEDMPASNKITNRTRNNSKVETTKPEHEVKEIIEGNEVHRKSRRAQKNPKEEQKSEDHNETQKTFSSDADTSKRTRRECREDSMVKEETVKETTTRRTRRHAEEEDIVKLEDQTKKSRRTRKDSREGANTEETVKESCIEEDKVETVGRKTTRKTNKNSDEKTSVPKSKQTEGNSKSPRLSKTRAKTSDECAELHGDVEEASKGAEESLKQSPHEDKSKPAVRRGRPAAKKEDIPPVSTPVASRKRGQATKAEAAVKRQKADEIEEQVELGVVETPKSRRGRPRKLVPETENTQTVAESSLPDPSPSRSTRRRSSSSLSNTPETRTLRRKNCLSTSATSQHVGQSGSAPKILFTGVVDTEDREETIRALGGDIAESVFDCTHLVTDRVIRTVKFLCAIARGIPIVKLDWIDKCKKSGCFLSPTGFLVNDKEQEKKFNFTLSGSLEKAKMRPLFEGYEIHVTANVKPEVNEMKDIIRCSGATFLPKIPRSFKEKCVVVSCAEDASRCKPVPASVPITSAEFILSGILRQEVNPTAYLLDAAVLDTRPPPAKRRR